MACVMVDTTYPFSDEAMRLCRMLSNPLADALPVRLWCWGIETNREKGVFEADAEQLAKIVRFAGDSDQLLKAFIACDVIESTGNANEYRIKGWKRNARLFSERKRLRKLNSTRGARVQNAKRTKKERVEIKLSSSSSSSSSSPISKEIGEGSTPPRIETLQDAQTLAVTTAEAHELFEHWQAECERVHHRAKTLMAPPAAIANARQVVALAGRDMALAKSVTTRFVESRHRYWVDKHHALYVLANGSDFEHARLSGAHVKAKRFETPDELEARLDREAREGEERGMRGHP